MSELRTRFTELNAATVTRVAPAPPLDGLIATARRRRHRRLQAGGVSVVVATMVVSAGALALQGRGERVSQPAPAAPVSTSETATSDPLTQAEVDDLTTPGRVYDGDELELADQAFVQRWGGVRPEVVSEAIDSVCQKFESACAGYFFDAATLTFTLRIVSGADGAAGLGAEAAAAYTAANGDANFKFETAPGKFSLPAAQALVDEINDPAKRRPELLRAGFDEGSFGARYLAGDGERVVVLIATPAMKAFFEDLYGDRISAEYPSEDMRVGGGYAPS